MGRVHNDMHTEMLVYLGSIVIAAVIIALIVFFDQRLLEEQTDTRLPDIVTTDGRECWVTEDTRIICR